MCLRSSTRLSQPWPSSRGRLSARRFALSWILCSSHPLLLVRALPLLQPQFMVDPPPWPPPLLLPPLSLLLALSPWPVTPLPPLRPCPCLVPRAWPPWLLPHLMSWIRLPLWPSACPVWPLPPTSFCGRCPNALLLPSPPSSALRLVPVVPRGSPLPLPPLPVPCVPVMRLAGLLAGSTSSGTLPPCRCSPTPFLLPLPLSSFRQHSPLCLRSRSQPVLIALGIPQTCPITTSTFAGFTSQHLPPTLALSHLVLFAPLCSLALCPHIPT